MSSCGEMRKVERFSELREGVRVELRNGCREGGNHPGILVHLHHGVPVPLMMGGGVIDGWELVPKPACTIAQGFLITTMDVAAGHVFRHVDFDASDDREVVDWHELAGDKIAAIAAAVMRRRVAQKAGR